MTYEAMLQRPEHLIYSGSNPDMFKTWSLGPVVNSRDMSYVDQRSRYVGGLHTLARRVDPECLDHRVESFDHWGIGWVDHLTFRVFDSDGKPTKVARKIKERLDEMEGEEEC